MNDLAEYLSKVERPMRGPYRRPRDSATLVLLDGPPSAPRVLLGKRHERHAFLPGKYVFPGGALDAADRRVPAVGALDPHSERRLLERVKRPTAARARALALAAIRETCEETGVLIGTRDGAVAAAPSPAWQPFAEAGVRPNLGALTFIARAITPPGRPRRFDTRFFIAHRKAVAAELPGKAGPDSELVELRWFDFEEARGLNMPSITKVLLAEVEARLRGDLSPALPVPFYYFRHGRAHREVIE